MHNPIIVIIFALPIALVIKLLVVAEPAWYETISIGIVSAMIAGLWLRKIS